MQRILTQQTAGILYGVLVLALSFQMEDELIQAGKVTVAQMVNGLG